MALNYSHRPIFPARIAEENLVSPMRMVNGYLVDGIPDKNVEGFGRSRCRDIDENEDCGKDRVDGCGSSDSVAKDIVDLLPSDPFGMDLGSTVTAITGWLENLEVDYGRYGMRNYGWSRNADYGLFAGFSVMWNSAMRFQSHPANIESLSRHTEDRNFASQSGHDPAGSKASITVSVNKTVGMCHQRIEESSSGVLACSDANFGVPHDALPYALCHLGVKDLLSVEMTCRSLCNTVRSSPWLWSRIHVDKPLNERITDDSLLRLTSRAQGGLRCLSLLECSKITDDGLKRVVESNPRLNKLCVPACTRLSIDGIVGIVKTFNHTKGPLGLKCLRIGGLYGVTHEHFETLKVLLDADEWSKQKVRKPHFYVRENIYMLCDDDRAIDVEVCPRCQNLRLVYDCPAEGCQGTDQKADLCRGCSLCVARCIQCGRCINDNEYEETFCLELLCSDCLST